MQHALERIVYKPLISQKFQISDTQDFYKESVNILDDLSSEGIKKIIDQVNDEKKQKEKFELFESYNSEKIFFEILNSLTD